MSKISDKEMESIYYEFCENDYELASDHVRESYSRLSDIFGEYVGFLCEDSFKKGYRYALMRRCLQTGEYKNRIHNMIDSIDDNERLKKIYTVVKHMQEHENLRKPESRNNANIC